MPWQVQSNPPFWKVWCIMLVLSRKLRESIVIADDIVIHFLRSHGNRIEIGIEAPRDVLVLRSELCDDGSASVTQRMASKKGRIGEPK